MHGSPKLLEHCSDSVQDQAGEEAVWGQESIITSGFESRLRVRAADIGFGRWHRPQLKSLAAGPY
jgi:hypothetical protein